MRRPIERRADRVSTRTLFASVVLASALALSACGETPPTRFYTLTTPIGGDEVVTRESGAPPRKPSDASFAVGPVDVAEFLDRPQIVRRVDANQLALSDFDHWAEPLQSMIARAVAERLAADLGAGDVAILPSTRPLDLDWAVSVDVLRFDLEADGRVVADFRWRITGAAPSDLLHSARTTVARRVAPGEVAQMVAALDAAIVVLSRDIAAAAPKRVGVEPAASDAAPRPRPRTRVAALGGR